MHRTTSSHARAWDEPRTYGPVLRFDPHPLPRGDHPRHGVWHGATDVHGALAEAFQATRTIDRVQEAQYLTGLHPVRDLRLLDVGGFRAGRWPTRVGGTFALDFAPHGITPRWARTTAAAHPGLDGPLYRSGFSGGPVRRCLPRRLMPSRFGRRRRTRSRIPVCNAVSLRPRRRSDTPSSDAPTKTRWHR
ncbi:hypothetical protein RW1_006_00230 [Rhodococcus wratislaviensis NBRC 100605]|uniref:RES domain-containing protein n=1 Tax=Rhodococcus wratislaviensis NBRC 100605 TaxID=1219028 RepID=X0PZB7_RHOWR|nr:hypothetical protein RW1_006_00230 [Rhodococcus wratislaviensis NBRC 100605]